MAYLDAMLTKTCPFHSVGPRSDVQAYVFSVLARTSTEPVKVLRVPAAVLRTILACMTPNNLQKIATFRVTPTRHHLPALPI